ncbi:hypothetical protein K2Z84_09090 [Candidatus Binatia bacterium]|jgi:ElaB/YqjD/DUF883 family membrane-anchored ribosome-binding protein|nr:hypothetical protein [Candidatus Binatia bacterium]
MTIDHDDGSHDADQRPRSNGAASDEAGVSKLLEQSRRVRDDLEGLVSAVADARSEWEEQLRARLTERPYVGLAAAAGVGYVLGAGVSPLLLRAAFGLGTRVAFAMVMRRVVGALGDAAMGRANA